MQTRNWRLAVSHLIFLGILAVLACGGAAKPEGQGTPEGPAGISVSLSPSTVVVAPSHTQTFTASVAGSSDTGVTWTVDGIAHGNATVGTLSGSGSTVTYSAPAADGTHYLVATSTADASRAATAKITVRDSCAPAPTSSEVANVRNSPYDAAGDGGTDDTQAIQSAVNHIAGTGGTVLVPSGTYLINAAAGGVLLKSNMTLRLEAGCVLLAQTTSSSSYSILRLAGASGVNITGAGVLQGERYRHTGSGGEGGRGLNLSNAHNVIVENLTVKDCWGDGFYVGASATNITLCNVVSSNSRRSGISLTDVDGLTIQDSVFQGSNGTIPECGLNIEPNAGEVVTNVQVLGSTFQDNHGTGVAVGVPCSFSATVTNIVIDGNTMSNNGFGALAGAESGVEVSKCSGTRITNNTASSNSGHGILLRACGSAISTGANSSVVSWNTVSTNGQAGILEEYCDNNTITGNTGSGNKRYGIHSSNCTNRHISGNGSGLPVTYTN